MALNTNPGSLQGTMTSGNPVGQINIDDPAVQFMKSMADTLAQPAPPPAMASPLHQTLALLAANAGAQLLHQPSAANMTNELVQAEQAKPEKYRLETEQRKLMGQKMRLESMIRASDNAAKQAEREGDWNVALAKHKMSKELQEEHDGQMFKLQELEGRQRLNEIGAKGAQDRKTDAQQIAGRERLASVKADAIGAQYGLTKNQVTELNTRLRESVVGPGYIASVGVGGGTYNADDAAAVDQKIGALGNQWAAEIKHRDSPFGDMQTLHGSTAPSDYKAAYEKYSKGK